MQFHTCVAAVRAVLFTPTTLNFANHDNAVPRHKAAHDASCLLQPNAVQAIHSCVELQICQTSYPAGACSCRYNSSCRLSTSVDRTRRVMCCFQEGTTVNGEHHKCSLLLWLVSTSGLKCIATLLPSGLATVWPGCSAVSQPASSLGASGSNVTATRNREGFCG